MAETLRLLGEESQAKGFAIQAYCFMPDHLHLLTNGTRPDSDCMIFVKIFKQRSAYQFRRATDLWLWQYKTYDYIFARRRMLGGGGVLHLDEPVRKGLCERPQDWPFSGSCTLAWVRLLTPRNKLWFPPRDSKRRACSPK